MPAYMCLREHTHFVDVLIIIQRVFPVWSTESKLKILFTVLSESPSNIMYTHTQREREREREKYRGFVSMRYLIVVVRPFLAPLSSNLFEDIAAIEVCCYYYYSHIT